MFKKCGFQCVYGEYIWFLVGTVCKDVYRNDEYIRVSLRRKVRWDFLYDDVIEL